MIRLFRVSVATILLGPAVADAQPLGVFRWQLQPYCNVVTLAVTQNGGVYRLEGTDDQCGSARAAAVTGIAFLNADGSIGFGLTIVAAPGGAPVHVEATVSLSTLSGTWRDSAGGSGAFVSTPGGGAGGSPRPLAAKIGALSVDPSQIQLRITNGCSGGQFVQGIAQSGSALCGTPAGGGTITGVTAGTGLVGGGTNGGVSVALQTTASGGFNFSNTSGLVSAGILGVGSTAPTSGPGVRAMWYPFKAAFRAGEVHGSQWDAGNIGFHSTAFGANTIASGTHSFAAGDSTTASGPHSAALGGFTTASGPGSFAAGGNTQARGARSAAFGRETLVDGSEAFATGIRARADGEASVGAGFEAEAIGTHTIALGSRVRALAAGSFIFGDDSPVVSFAPAPNSFMARASGGVYFYTNAAHTAGLKLDAGGSQWLGVSDANAKENFRELAGEDVLAKLAAMPMHEWNYKSQAPTIRHVGPTAQDFHAAFGLGEDPLRIGTMDADGIALAGVKALEARTHELRSENEALRTQLRQTESTNEALSARLAEIERLLQRIAR